MKKALLTQILLLLIAISSTATASAYLIKGLEEEIDTADIEIDGKRHILLTALCKANGIDWEWDSISQRIILRKNNREAIFLVGSEYYYTDGKFKNLSSPLQIKDGSIFIPLKFAKYDIKRLFELEKKSLRAPTSEVAPKRKTTEAEELSGKRYKIRRIVLDPGHGGKDPGAIGRTGLYEKDIVLDVTMKVKDELERKGIDVIMTRDSDRFIPLNERAEIANKNRADLFVSIHTNANRRRWIRGFEVYYLSEATDDNGRALAASENSVLKYEDSSFAKHTKNLDAIIWDLTFTENREESIELAGFICQEADKRLNLKSNKVRRARFYVLKGAEMPAVLVELSYLSNRWDEKNLMDSYYRGELAKGVAEGIASYKYEYERTNGFSR